MSVTFEELESSLSVLEKKSATARSKLYGARLGAAVVQHLQTTPSDVAEVRMNQWLEGLSEDQLAAAHRRYVENHMRRVKVISAFDSNESK